MRGIILKMKATGINNKKIPAVIITAFFVLGISCFMTSNILEIKNVITATLKNRIRMRRMPIRNSIFVKV